MCVCGCSECVFVYLPPIQHVVIDSSVRPFRLDDTDASRGITPVMILWVTSYKRMRK